MTLPGTTRINNQIRRDKSTRKVIAQEMVNEDSYGGPSRLCVQSKLSPCMVLGHFKRIGLKMENNNNLGNQGGNAKQTLAKVYAWQCKVHQLALLREAKISSHLRASKKVLGRCVDAKRRGDFLCMPEFGYSVMAIKDCDMHESHKSKILYSSGFLTKMYQDMEETYWWPILKANIIPMLANVLDLCKVKAEHSCDLQLGIRLCLRFAWKGVVRFGKRGKLNPRYVGPFKVLKKVGAIAYKLELPQELSRVHNTFHVSNLKKCYSDDPLVVPLEGLQVDDKLHFVEEPVEVMDREVKQLRRSRVPIVKIVTSCEVCSSTGRVKSSVVGIVSLVSAGRTNVVLAG
ncbi:hypothetical protein Tco_0383538 [Tanacetum coccineum]